LTKCYFGVYSLAREQEADLSVNFYLIKDLSRISGNSIHTVKYYLKIGLIKEKGRSPETGYRYFDDETVEALKTIRALRRQGRPIKQIKDELL